jgi:predicted O-methyltransferase YrrM
MNSEDNTSNKIHGWFNYHGVAVMQHPSIKEPFKELFQTIQPRRVLEIGTSYGGFTLLLRHILDEIGLGECDLRTYDISPDHDRTILLNSNLNYDLRIRELFNHTYSDLNDTHGQEVIDYISQDGPTIVLCDGGSKKNEFNILSKFLKPGDIIMAHDYAPSEEYFEANNRGKVWDWCEVSDKDVAEAFELYNLEPYMEDVFTSVVWLCRIKS